jgi:hypothetical protein
MFKLLLAGKVVLTAPFNILGIPVAGRPHRGIGPAAATTGVASVCRPADLG